MLQRIQPPLATSSCVEEQVGGQDREHRPGDQLASRDGERDERKRADEQQAVGIGSVAQMLQAARVKAPRLDNVVEVEGDCAEEGEPRQEDRRGRRQMIGSTTITPRAPCASTAQSAESTGWFGAERKGQA